MYVHVHKHVQTAAEVDKIIVLHVWCSRALSLYIIESPVCSDLLFIHLLYFLLITDHTNVVVTQFLIMQKNTCVYVRLVVSRRNIDTENIMKYILFM